GACGLANRRSRGLLGLLNRKRLRGRACVEPVGGGHYLHPMPYSPAATRYDDGSFYRRCGRSGLMLPAIALGCWHNFGAPGSDSGHHGDEASMHENARRMLFTAFDHGITHFDLANNYGPPPGSAEERVGRILHED